MTNIKTYEFFNIFKKKSKIISIPNSEFTINEVGDLLRSDLDGINFRGQDISSLIDLHTTSFYGQEGKPKIDREKNWFGHDISHSLSSHNGIDGILMVYNMNPIISEWGMAVMPDKFFLSNKIHGLINKDRMDQFGIGYCINKHYFIGDSILFYNK